MLRLSTGSLLLLAASCATCQEMHGHYLIEPYVRVIDRKLIHEKYGDKKNAEMDTFEELVRRRQGFLGVDQHAPPGPLEPLTTSFRSHETAYTLDLYGAIKDSPIHIFGLGQSVFRLESKSGFWRPANNGTHVFYAKGVRCALRLVWVNILGAVFVWASDPTSSDYMANKVTLQQFGSARQLLTVHIASTHSLADSLDRVATAMQEAFQKILKDADVSDFEAMEVATPITGVTAMYSGKTLSVQFPKSHM